MACSDGAGSAELSDLGSSRACEAIVQIACEDFQTGLTPNEVTEATIKHWFQFARSRIDQLAEEQGMPARQYACTLLLAILGETESVFAQLGDGAVVVKNGAEFSVMFWPQSGEYLNVTYFITDDDSHGHIQFAKTGPLSEIALFTDGLQLLALNYSSATVHQGFFEPLFSALRTSTAFEELRFPLKKFLESERVCERTDDDKTLVMAVRSGRA